MRHEEEVGSGQWPVGSHQSAVGSWQLRPVSKPETRLKWICNPCT